MRLCVFIEPQFGVTYDDELAVARRTEECGFDGFFRSDHFLTMGKRGGPPGPTDSWVTLGALARDTARVRLGTLVSSATFRLPGPLAIAVAQVDQMSGGRVELGLGAGWYEAEHTAYGIPFPPVRERFDRLEEQLEIITGLWATPSGSTFTFQGARYDVIDSPALPKPVQRPGPPIIVGGTGPRRTPNLAARFADEYNVPFASLATTAECYARVAAACEELGRDADRRAPLVFSAAQTIVVGRTDAEVARRVEAIGRTMADARQRGVTGTVNDVIDQLAEFGKIGSRRLFLQILDLADLDHLDLIAAEVAPQLDFP